MNAEVKRFGQAVETATAGLVASHAAGECSTVETRLALQGAMVLVVRTIVDLGAGGAASGREVASMPWTERMPMCRWADSDSNWRRHGPTAWYVCSCGGTTTSEKGLSRAPRWLPDQDDAENEEGWDR